jgi:hypothetical protein
VTVPVRVCPLDQVCELEKIGIATEEIVGAGELRMEIEAFADVSFAEAVIPALLVNGTGKVPTVKATEVPPAGMATVDGSSIAGLSLAREMIVGVGSTAVVKTIPTKEFPPVTADTGGPIEIVLK